MKQLLIAITFALVMAMPDFVEAVSPTPVPSPSPTASMQPIAKPLAGEVRINEFLPNPVGTDTGNEWVELANVSTHTIDVGGLLVVRISGSTILTVPTGTTIVAGGVAAFTNSGSLINTGDTLILKTGTTELDRVTYDDTGGEGQSWARSSATEGTWTDVTSKGEVNPIPAPEAGADPEGIVTAATSATGKSTTATTKASTASSKTSATKTSAAKKLPAGGTPWAGYVLPMTLAMLYWYKRIRTL